MIAITYTSSQGEVFDLMTSDIPGRSVVTTRVKEANFHKFSWEAEVTKKQFGERVERWKRPANVTSAVLMFQGSLDARKRALNAFHAAIDGDFIRKSPGRLTWNDWYINAYIRSSSTYPSEGNARTLNEVEIYCPDPFWVTEQKVVIDPESGMDIRSTDKTYDDAYAYPYSYRTAPGVPRFYLDHYAPCAIQAKIHGPVSSVNLMIGDAPFIVQHSVPAGAYMVIDTREGVEIDRHCYIVSGDTITNCFNDRDPSTQLIRKISPGFSKVRYQRTTRLELTIYKERSEPAW